MSKLTSLLAVSAIAMASQSAFASDGTITFTGQVTDTTCAINAGTPNVAVGLPTVSASALGASAATAGATPFKISLTGCTGSATKVATFFEGGATVDAASGRLNVTGGATNVQLRLKNAADGSVIKVGATEPTQGSKQVTLASGAADLNYVAEYYATAAATSGAVNSSVTYSIRYE